MIIGLCGKKRSGKDTVADFLCSEYNFKKISFAHPLKRALQEIFGWSEEYVQGDKKDIVDPYWGISPRQAMQLLGTDFAQYILGERVPLFLETTGRLLWVKRCLQEIEKDPFADWVISDVRFPHELEALQLRGASIIRITRPVVNRIIDTHESETLIQDLSVDIDILNDGSIFELYSKVIDAMHQLLYHTI